MVTATPISTIETHQTVAPGSGRRLFKRIAISLAWVLVGPLVIAARIEARIFGPGCERAFSTGKELLAFFPGVLGQYLRLAYYWSTCREVSPGACFVIGSMLAHRDVAIGEGTVIGAHSIVGRAEIGCDVMVAARVSVVSGKYLHGRPSDRARGVPTTAETERIRIGDSCWIGENAVIMASIGERCTVAAGAIVMREADAASTLMGNPARKVNL
jgi:virginiamycin A acetyltransferase